MDITQFNHAHLSTILETARQHYQDEEYGKCCSYYLLIFHYDVAYCNSLKHEFISAVCKWLKKLILLNRMEEVFSFIETSVEICFPIRIDIALAASQTLFMFQYIFESAKLLPFCRENGKINYSLEENIEQLYNTLIDRWHFRMLNDKKRNMAYSLALTNAYQRGHRKVLDIGSGTGIFSLIAFKLGFEMIYSCEASDVMCHIQKKCINANGAANSIHLINKLSTELDIGRDFHEKSTLLITEIFDCGLLGEGVLSILINAWDKLLDVEHGEVIPHSAVVYGICIECEELRRHSRYQVPNGCFLYGCKDPGDQNKQPYSTEYMAGIKGGYRKLSNPFIVKSFNFNQFTQLKEMVGKSDIIEVPIIANGILDAIMVYFTLNIDSSLEINTLDESGLCWEQAIYNIPFHREIRSGDNIMLDVYCGEEHLGIKIINEKDVHPGKHIESQLQSSKTSEINVKDKKNSMSSNMYTINRRLVARLNDNVYVEKYKSAILYHVKLLKATHTKELNICFICPEISIFPLFVSQFDLINIYLIDPSDNLLELLQPDISLDRIKCVSRPMFNELTSSKIIFDLVISEPIDCNGLIMENYIEDLNAIKLFSSDNTIFIPSNINVYGCCITSERLLHENRVLNNNIPLSLNIGEFINEYRVNTHPDVDGNLLINNLLSEKYLILHIDLCKKFGKETVESFKCFDITFTRSGTLTGLVYWFDIVLYGEERISTEPSEDTHWHQACVIFPQQKFVSDNDKLTLSVTRNESNFHFQVC